MKKSGESAAEARCLRCGACCRQPFSHNTSPEDLVRWERERRFDLIAAVREEERAREEGGFTAFKSFKPCRFNKSAGDQRTCCAIYEQRPVVCRGFIPGRSRLCPASDAPGRSD